MCRHTYIYVVLKLIVLVIFATSFVEFLYPNANLFVEMRDGFDAGRVYGLASRPSSTATLLVSSAVALFMIGGDWNGGVRSLGKSYLFLIPVTFLMLASGTGVLALIIAAVFVVYQLKGVAPIYQQATKLLALLFGLAIFVYGLTLIGELGSHVGLEYLDFLYKIKYESITDNIKLDEIWMGRVKHEFFQYGSDFGIAALLAHIGIVGFALHCLLIVINVNYYNIAAVAIILIGYFHYAAIVTSSGSLVFAVILALARLDEPLRKIGVGALPEKSRLVAINSA